MKKGSVALWIILAVVALLIVGGLIYYIYAYVFDKNPKAQTSQPQAQTQTSEEEQAPAKTANTYTSTSYGYTVDYPLSWKYKETGLSTYFDDKTITTTPEGYTAKIWVTVTSKTISRIKSELTINSSSQTTLDGLTATRINAEDVLNGTSLTAVLCRKGSKTYGLWLSGSEHSVVFEQMVTSFKFSN